MFRSRVGDNGNTTMLNQIKANPQETRTESPLKMLLDCHERIRHFIQVAQKLAQANNVPVSQIAEAAGNVHRYFSISLKLHEQDEDVTLHPRMRGKESVAKDAADSSNAMVIQHQTIDDVVTRLLPIWERVATDPVALSSFDSQTTALTNRLAELMEGHLRLEEEQVFPAIERLFNAEEQSEMADEMRARRA
jgi:hemerythrin-like domain-containing protein